MADRGTHGPFFGGPKFLILATSTAAYYAPSPGPEHRTPRPSRGLSRIPLPPTLWDGGEDP